jgi:hypothetical protein
MSTDTANCRCGAISVEVEREPAAMGICHCNDCRGWSASPVNGVAIWPRDKMTVAKGEDQIDSYASSEGHQRAWCKKAVGMAFGKHSRPWSFR